MSENLQETSGSASESKRTSNRTASKRARDDGEEEVEIPGAPGKRFKPHAQVRGSRTCPYSLPLLSQLPFARCFRASLLLPRSSNRPKRKLIHDLQAILQVPATGASLPQGAFAEPWWDINDPKIGLEGYKAFMKLTTGKIESLV